MQRQAVIGFTMLALLAGGGLTACNPSGGDAGAGLTSPIADAKITAYTAAFNTLLGSTPQVYGGLSKQAEAYLGWDIAAASPDDIIELELNPDWLPGVLARLKAARALPGDADLAPVDRVADRLIAQIETIRRVEGGLVGYYEGRVYRQDGLARGKAADPELRKAYEDAWTSMQEMEAALAVVQRKAGEVLISRLESRGHVAEASLLKAMAQGDLMTTAVLDGDRAAADRAADALQLALDDMRQKKPRLKKAADGETYDLVIQSLTGALASYRDSEPDSDITAQLVVPQYNNAVHFSGTMSLPR